MRRCHVQQQSTFAAEAVAVITLDMCEHKQGETHRFLGIDRRSPTRDPLHMDSLNQLDSSNPGQLHLTVKSVTFQDEESGWTVLKGRDRQQDTEVCAVGYFTNVYPGEQFVVFGRWIQHRQFGKQFQVERAVEQRPSTKPAIRRYLASGMYKGIGPKTAERIVDHFGTETFDVLDGDPDRLKQVPKVSKKVANSLITSWQAKRQAADSLMFLSEHGITGAMARRVIRVLEKRRLPVIDTISQNPYTLIRDVPGIGFLTADRIAMSVGISTRDPKRIEEAALHSLEKAAERGHCYLEHTQLGDAVAKLLDLEPGSLQDLLAEALDRLQAELRLASVPLPLDEGDSSCHYLLDLHSAERAVASHIKRLQESAFSGIDPNEPATAARMKAWLERYCKKLDITLSPEQWEAVLLGAASKLFVLTGGPGVGKTTTANALIQLFKAMGRSTSLCAPTGRAAQRIFELSSIPAKTIHRLLEWSPQSAGFSRNLENPLATQVIICDEASMLDIRLAAALLEAVPSTAQLILIGDVDQLPAVGPGNVLNDVIRSGIVTTVHLKTVFRQAATSHIVQTAHAINAGDPPLFCNDGTSDCWFLPCDSPDQILDQLKDLMTTHLAEAGYQVRTDVQVLTPVNRGDLGSKALNEFLQELVNPAAKALGGLKHRGLEFRRLDKVIQTVNNYDLGVFNGDIGYISEVHSSDKRLKVEFLGKQVTYESDDLNDLQLAYAITIHKAQGSEFPVVLMPLSMSHFVMLQRNLIYTGLTRARRLALFVGQSRALDVAIKNNTSGTRQTRLAQQLEASS